VKEKAKLQAEVKLMEKHISMYKTGLYEERYNLFVKRLKNIENQINM
jgi:hypothetical protein